MGRKGKDDRKQNTLAQLAQSIPFSQLAGGHYTNAILPYRRNIELKKAPCLLDIFL
jgi:hypothetical protein